MRQRSYRDFYPLPVTIPYTPYLRKRTLIYIKSRDLPSAEQSPNTPSGGNRYDGFQYFGKNQESFRRSPAVFPCGIVPSSAADFNSFRNLLPPGPVKPGAPPFPPFDRKREENYNDFKYSGKTVMSCRHPPHGFFWV